MEEAQTPQEEPSEVAVGTDEAVVEKKEDEEAQPAEDDGA